MEFYLAALPELYERRLREAVLAYMREELEKEGKRSESEPFETLMEKMHLSEAILISLNQKRWGMHKSDYAHPIELFFHPETRNRSQTFWRVLEANGEQSMRALAISRDLTRREAWKLLNEERDEILDLVAVLNRLRLVYENVDLFNIEARERLVTLATQENQREAERIRRLRRAR
ncbi:hypothetical protein [Verrucomicrobium sp. GAS474]|uniref:hypothetical protein n=1 Tax=Verrucomicrobium sp. GAS474 TaxID=1882831 RepID=UPI0012FFB682|nr:hypothetical protein [Verrucomicrobium sp. GAS474]